MKQWKRRVPAMLMASALVLGTVAAAAGAVAIEKMARQAVKYQTSEPDTVSSATVTSSAIADQLEHLMVNDLIEKYDTLEEMAVAHDMDPKVLTATVQRYSGLVKGGADTDYNRPYYCMAGSDMSTGPYYFIDTEMCLHTSWGGIVTNIDGQVLTPAEKVISGLYAAGECTRSKVQGNGSAAQGPVWGSICEETILKQK